MSISSKEHGIIYACTEVNRHMSIGLSPEDFTDPLAKRLWSLLKSDNGISDTYRALEKLELSNDNKNTVLSWMDGEFPSDSSIKDTVKFIIDRNNKNKITRILSSAMRDLSNGSSIEDIKSSIFGGLASTRVDDDGYVKLHTIVDQMEQDYKNPVSFIETGLPSLDGAFCGLVRKKLHVVAGRPGTGKTAFSLTVAKNVASSINPDTGKNYIVSIHSLEMDNESLCGRLISAHTGHSQSELMRHEPDLDWDDIRKEMSRYDISIDDKASQSIEHIRSQLLYKKYTTGLDVVIVDYIGIMNKDSYHGMPTTEAIGKITSELREAAKELNIAVVVLAQLNRNVDSRAVPMPIISDLSSSGSLEQDADVIILLMRPEIYFPEKIEYKDVAYVILGKCRWGKPTTLEMKFNGPRVRYEDNNVRKF